MKNIDQLDEIAIADYNRRRRVLQEMVHMLDDSIEPILLNLTKIGDDPTPDELEALACRWEEIEELMTESSYWQYEARVRPKHIRRKLQED